MGAHSSGLIGDAPTGIPSNLAPYSARVAVRRREHLVVHRDDYNTVDGTGVRDYIHAEDLALGHVAALERLGSMEEPVGTWELGTGIGVSVLQMVAAFRQASGHRRHVGGPYGVRQAAVATGGW